MKTLLWKEYRQNRMIVGVTLLLIVLPYLGCLAAYLGQEVILHNQDQIQWRNCFGVACIYSLCLPQLAMALMGGNLIAGERADRSAEFQASLPIRRNQLLIAKLMLSLLLVGVIWLFNPLFWIGFVGPFQNDLNETAFKEFACDGRFLLYAIFMIAAVTGLIFFCGAWLASACTASPVLSVCSGFAVPLIASTTLFAIAGFSQMSGTNAAPFVRFWYCVTCLPVALICFAIGTWVYLRRVEP
jgi:ABC-type transport system involved in multi-copper enzyme maturation permease subunit